MVTAFWDSHRIIFIDYLEKGKTINAAYYAALLQRFSDDIRKDARIWRERAFSPRQRVSSHVTCRND